MFVSYSFIAFILSLFVLYYIIPKKLQWVLLLVANFGFYYSAGKWYPLFILVTATTVYFTGILMSRQDDKVKEYNAKVKAGEIPKPSREEKKAVKNKINGKKKMYMLICLFFNLGILAVTKYTNFLGENIFGLLNKTYKPIDIIVPLGISFYTFIAVAYLLDVYWNKCEAQRNYLKFVLYITFFPQLIQGPISRYADVSKTMFVEHKFDWRRVRFGLERILWGYFKKLVVADRLGTATGELFNYSNGYTGGYVLIGMFFWAAQLYADFTGGIDITIGIAQVFGIDLEENFIRPFFSKDIAEYWRRWHVTMGTWFRDYVFYPLSISHVMKNITTATKKKFGMAGAKRVAIYISTFLVWLATGIWHGPAWHFVVWGLVNGVVILASEECKPLYAKFHSKFPKVLEKTWYRAFQIIRTFMLMCCIRMFDTYADVTVAFQRFFEMFTKFKFKHLTLKAIEDLGLTRVDYGIVLVGVILMFIVSMIGRRGSVREKIAEKPYVIRFGIFVLLFFATLLFGSYGLGFDSQQFIYNQF